MTPEKQIQNVPQHTLVHGLVHNFGSNCPVFEIKLLPYSFKTVLPNSQYAKIKRTQKQKDLQSLISF